MRKGFPPNSDLEGVIQFYFQCCSQEVTARKLSYVAATLANGGVNPLSGERIFEAETVRNCLSIMFVCGMYDFSGEFAFKVGIPSKSGVAGAILSVVPNVMGICTFSPPLDEFGNSVRGVDFLTRLNQEFSFHQFHIGKENGAKPDRLKKRVSRRSDHAQKQVFAVDINHDGRYPPNLDDTTLIRRERLVARLQQLNTSGDWNHTAMKHGEMKKDKEVPIVIGILFIMVYAGLFISLITQ